MDLNSMSEADLLSLRNQLLQQNKTVVPTAQPTANTDTTGLVGATAKDIGRGAYQGGVRGVAGLAGAPADFTEMGAQAANDINRYFHPEVPERQPTVPSMGSNAMQTAIDQYITSLMGGKIGKPESGIGKLAEKTAEYAPALAFGKERYLARPFTRLAGPMAGEWAAGAVTADTPAEPYARFGGALLGGPIAGRMMTPFRAREPLRTVRAENLDANGIGRTLSAADRTGSPFLSAVEGYTGKPKWATPEETERQMTARALRETGIPNKDSFLDDVTGHKTVLSDRMAAIGKEYDRIETALLSKLDTGNAAQKKLAKRIRGSSGEKRNELVGNSLGPNSPLREEWETANRQYAVANDLETVAKKESGPFFKPKDVADATKDAYTKDLHNIAASADHLKQKVKPYDLESAIALPAALGGMALGSHFGGALGGTGGNLYGLGSGILAGGAAGGFAGNQAKHLARVLLGNPLTDKAVNNRPVQNYLGNQIVPEAMWNIGPTPRVKGVPIPLAPVIYSTDQRNPESD